MRFAPVLVDDLEKLGGRGIGGVLRAVVRPIAFLARDPPALRLHVVDDPLEPAIGVVLERLATAFALEDEKLAVARHRHGG